MEEPAVDDGGAADIDADAVVCRAVEGVITLNRRNHVSKPHHLEIIRPDTWIRAAGYPIKVDVGINPVHDKVVPGILVVISVICTENPGAIIGAGLWRGGGGCRFCGGGGGGRGRRDRRCGGLGNRRRQRYSWC